MWLWPLHHEYSVQAGNQSTRGRIADGVPEVLRAVRQQVAAGADVIKLYASTGTDDDTTGFETYSYEEIKAAWTRRISSGKRLRFIRMGRMERATRCGQERIRWSMRRTWTTQR